MYSCAGLVQFKCKKTPILVSRGKIPYSVDVSISDTPGPSDPVPIAGDRRGVLGSSDPVSTAARRGNGSHYGGAGCERIISIHSLDVHYHFKCKLVSGCVGASD